VDATDKQLLLCAAQTEYLVDAYSGFPLLCCIQYSLKITDALKSISIS
jgi:hypothetical protein